MQSDSNPAGSSDSSQEAPSAGYTLQEAAALLGISVNTLRRRLDAGQVRGERIKRPQGYMWRVYLAADRRNGHTQAQSVQEAGQPAASTLQQPPASTALAQAELMGNLVAPLIQQAIVPLVEELAATRAQMVSQAEEVGRLRLERDQLAEQASLTDSERQELAVLRAEHELHARSWDKPAAEPRPSWWRRWLG